MTVLALLLAFAGADLVSLKGCDEAFYAQIAREMRDTGDWLTPRFQGTPVFDKPPLLMWLVALSFSVFGVGDLQARLPILLLAVVAVALVGLAAQEARGRAAGFWASGVVATTVVMLIVGHQVMTDVPALVGLAAAAWAVLGMRRDARWGWLLGPALGVVVLAKGALAVLVALAMVPYFLLVRPRWGLPAWAGLLVGLLPAAAWYGAMSAQYGGAFWQAHVGVHVLDRARRGLFVADSLGPAYYLVHGLWLLLPWTFLLMPAVVNGARKAIARDPLAVWSTGFLLVFGVAISLMQTRFHHYALPLVVPAAFLVADWLTEEGDARVRWVAGIYAFLGGVLAMAAGAAAFGLVPLAVSRVGAVVAVGRLAMGFILTCRVLWSGWREAGGLALLVGTGLAFLVAGVGLHPWDAEPGIRQATAAVPAGAVMTWVAPGAPADDYCTFSAVRWQAPAAFAHVTPEGFLAGGPGWYVGRPEHVQAGPADRVLVDSLGWRLVERK
jgi:4-amino-4-deoxy-L-arabinose transferase-like glycosyltransferase